MKWVVSAIIIFMVFAAPMQAIGAAVWAPTSISCPTCPACPYLGYPCPGLPANYYIPSHVYSYDQFFRFGGYSTVPGYYIPPETRFPPYLGIDASQQWFALPPR